jgi:hypothetical protein
MSSSLSSISGLSSSSATERAAMRQQMLQKMYSDMDTDGNSAVSKDEFVTSLESHKPESSGSTDSDMPSAEDIFDEADTDGDGSLTESEFTTYSAKMAPKGGPGGAPPMGGPRGAGGAQSSSAVSATEEEDDEDDDSSATDPADANGDGQVTVQEQLAYIKQQIEKYEQMAASESASGSTSALA